MATRWVTGGVASTYSGANRGRQLQHRQQHPGQRVSATNAASALDSSAFGYANTVSGTSSSAFGHYNPGQRQRQQRLRLGQPDLAAPTAAPSAARNYISAAATNGLAVGYENSVSGAAARAGPGQQRFRLQQHRNRHRQLRRRPLRHRDRRRQHGAGLRQRGDRRVATMPAARAQSRWATSTTRTANMRARSVSATPPRAPTAVRSATRTSPAAAAASRWATPMRPASIPPTRSTSSRYERHRGRLQEPGFGQQQRRRRLQEHGRLLQHYDPRGHRRQQQRGRRQEHCLRSQELRVGLRQTPGTPTTARWVRPT